MNTATCMDKLNRDLRAVPMCRVRKKHEPVNLVVLSNIELGGIVRSGIPIDRRRADVDKRHTGSRLLFDKVDIALGRLTDAVSIIADHRRKDNAIPKSCSAQWQRFVHVLVIIESGHMLPPSNRECDCVATLCSIASNHLQEHEKRRYSTGHPPHEVDSMFRAST